MRRFKKVAKTPQPSSLAGRFSARQASLRGFCRQAKKAKPLRDMKRVAHGRPPYDVSPMRRWPLAAKRLIRNSCPACGVSPTRAKNLIRLAPYQVFAAGSMRAPYGETGVPGPATFVVGHCQINIKIDPLPLRRDFEFLVSPDVVEIRTDEYLGHVPIPEPKCLGRGAGLGFYVQFIVRTN